MSKSLLNKPFPPDLSGIWDYELAIQLSHAQGALSGLNEAVSLLHNPNLLMRPLLGKEAESSTRLEGTQASIDEVYKSALVENPEKKDDVAEVINYQNAMNEGITAIAKRPLSQFVIRQTHKTLMQGVRGQTKNPGKYRIGDVWIGDDGTDQGEARYMPPDAMHIPILMDNLEKFIQEPKLSPIISSGIIHYQFEAIHPFKDGNGRTGRLLITLFLLKTGALNKPMLYPSGYFDKNKENYVDSLHGVDLEDNWHDWLMYYLKGIENQAKLSLSVAREIDKLYKFFTSEIQKETANLNLLRVLEFCFIQPYVTLSTIRSSTNIPENTLRRYVDRLVHVGLLSHIDTLSRGQKLYINLPLLTILRRI